MKRKNCSLFLVFLMSLSLCVSAYAKKRVLTIEWEEIEDAVSYEVKVIRKLSDGTEKEPSFFKTQKAVWKAKLSPGQYQMFIRSFDVRKVPGPWGEPQEFVVQVGEPKLLSPENKFSQETTEKSKEVTLRWQPLDDYKNYKLHIINKETSKEQTIDVEDSKFDFEASVPGSYEWSVAAWMDEQVEGKRSEKRTFSFTKKEEIKKKKITKKEKEKASQKVDSTQQRLEAFEHKNSWYLLGTGSLAGLIYTSNFFEELNNGAEFTTLAAHALGTVGFQRFLSHWGAEARLGFLGMTVSSGNYVVPDLTIRGFGRLFLGSKRLYLYGGIFAKDLPEFTGNSSEGLQNSNTLNMSGLHTAVRFEYPFSTRWMFDLSAELFLTTDAETTSGSPPNDEGNPSYNIQFLVKHKLWRFLRTSIGYKYSFDSLYYQTITTSLIPGESQEATNFVEMEIHQFIMGLEISF